MPGVAIRGRARRRTAGPAHHRTDPWNPATSNRVDDAVDGPRRPHRSSRAHVPSNRSTDGGYDVTQPSRGTPEGRPTDAEGRLERTEVVVVELREEARDPQAFADRFDAL